MSSKMTTVLFRVFTGALSLGSLALIARGLYLWDASAAFGLVLLMTSGILSLAAYVSTDTGAGTAAADDSEFPDVRRAS